MERATKETSIKGNEYQRNCVLLHAARAAISLFDLTRSSGCDGRMSWVYIFSHAGDLGAHQCHLQHDDDEVFQPMTGEEQEIAPWL